jgi:hypothetical protein
MEITSKLKDLYVKKEGGLEFFATGEYVTVGAMVLWAPPSGAVNDASTAAAVQGLRKRFGTEEVLDGGTKRIHLSWTDASERAIRVGNILELRLAFAPTCGGRMTIVLATSWRPSTFGIDTARAWLASVRASATDRACDALKSLRDP